MYPNSPSEAAQHLALCFESLLADPVAYRFVVSAQVRPIKLQVSPKPYLSYSLLSQKGFYRGVLQGLLRATRTTRSLDYSSYNPAP